MVVCSLALAVLMSPASTSIAADQLPPQPPTARENAVHAVNAAIASRSTMASEPRHELAGAIVEHSVKNKLDPLFVVAVIENESRFDTLARSIRCLEAREESCYLNAQGLMQVIPSTARSEIKRRGLGKLDMLKPIDNVDVGIGYLAHLGTGFKRIQSILWAYNQGPVVAMARAKGEIPPGWSLEKWEKAVREGEAFETRVMASYRKLLAERNIKADGRKMGALYRNPELTVYRAPSGPPVPTSDALLARR